jgi:mRNA interferase RelE/StbE
MRLILLPDAAKALRRMPRRDADALLARLRAVAADPFGEHPFAKAFGGGKGRVRQGDWRAVYRLDTGRDEMVVSRVAHRREAYR